MSQVGSVRLAHVQEAPIDLQPKEGSVIPLLADQLPVRPNVRHIRTSSAPLQKKVGVQSQSLSLSSNCAGSHWHLAEWRVIARAPGL
jgi:hypothetical protein